MRVIRTCRDMGITSVAVYSQADTEALHTNLADEKYEIGPPEAVESYLNFEKIIAVTKKAARMPFIPAMVSWRKIRILPNAAKKKKLLLSAHRAVACPRPSQKTAPAS